MRPQPETPAPNGKAFAHPAKLWIPTPNEAVIYGRYGIVIVLECNMGGKCKIKLSAGKFRENIDIKELKPLQK